MTIGVQRDGAEARGGQVEPVRRRVAADQLGQDRHLAAGDLDAGQLRPALEADADLLHHGRVRPLDGEVVEQRDRLRADADDVVDVHRDAVDPDGVVAAGLLGEDQLRADAVGPDRDPEVRRHLEHGGVVAGREHGARGAPGVDRLEDADERRDRAIGGVLVHAGPGVRVGAHRLAPTRSARPRMAPREHAPAQRRTATAARAARGRTRAARRAWRRTRPPRRPAGARQCVHGRPRHAFSAVAPASTGPATPNDSREASAREYPSARAAASVAPVRDTPGASAAAWASPSASPGRRGGASRGDPVGDGERHGADQQAARERHRPAEPLLDRPLEQVADHHGRRERQRERPRVGRARGAASGASASSAPACSATSSSFRRAGPNRAPTRAATAPPRRAPTTTPAATPQGPGSRPGPPPGAQADDASAAGASPPLRRRR